MCITVLNVWSPILNKTGICKNQSKIKFILNTKIQYAKIAQDVYETAAIDSNLVWKYCNEKKKLEIESNSKNFKNSIKIEKNFLNCSFFSTKEVGPGSFFLLNSKQKFANFPAVLHLSPWFYDFPNRHEKKIRRYEKGKFWFLDFEKKFCDFSVVENFEKNGKKIISEMEFEPEMLYPWLVHNFFQYFLYFYFFVKFLGFF